MWSLQNGIYGRNGADFIEITRDSLNGDVQTIKYTLLLMLIKLNNNQ